MKKLCYLILALAIGSTGCKKDKSNKDLLLESFSMKGTASSALYGTGLREENRVAKAFVDLTSRKMYTIEEAVNQQSNLNFVFASSYYGGTVTEACRDLIVSSLKSGRGWDTNTSDRTLKEFGVKTECFFKVLTEAELADFGALQTQQQLEDLFSAVKNEDFSEFTTCNSSASNTSRVYNIAFKTHTGKRGVFRMTNYKANKPFDFEIAIKMEK